MVPERDPTAGRSGNRIHAEQHAFRPDLSQPPQCHRHSVALMPLARLRLLRNDDAAHAGLG